MFKKLSFITVFMITVSSSFSQENALTAKEKSDGWKLLFDGKTFNGWHTYGREKATRAWSIQNGAFYLDAGTEKICRTVSTGISLPMVSMRILI